MLHSFALVCLTLMAKPSGARPSLQARTPDTGVVIPLFKRSSALDMQSTSVANLTVIMEHIAQVEAKYQQGLSNWQMNTGSFSLFAKSSHAYDYEAGGGMDEPTTSSSQGEFPTPDLGIDQAAPTSTPVFDSSSVQLPVVRKFHYLPSTAILTKHRQVFKARQSEPLINERNDQLWVGFISVGNNQQSFLIDFDT